MRHRVYKKERNDRISENADILTVCWQLAADVFFCLKGNPFRSGKQVYCCFIGYAAFFRLYFMNNAAQQGWYVPSFPDTIYELNH